MDESPAGEGRRGMSFGWRVVLFAAAYFLAGRLGLLFAEPPSSWRRSGHPRASPSRGPCTSGATAGW